MAVLFPAWVRLGSGVSTGVEALGQNVLAMMANLVTLGIALVPPMIIAWTSVLFLNASRGLSLAFVLVVASVVLAIETYGAMRFLGRALRRVEPLQTV
jgi:cytochrome bd-type quinol oxidase subunit 2